MRVLRSLLLALPLALGAGGAMATELTPADHYGHGGGYGYGRPNYAPPPPHHWRPAPVFRPYYAPPPRHWRVGPSWRPQPHWRHRERW